METLSDLLDSGANVASDEELKPLTAAIARNKASDRLRRHLADKRGGNNVQSLELMVESSAGEPAGFEQADFLDRLNVQELRELLTDLSAEVKKEYRIVLRDHFFDQLSYQEIAAKRQISLGSVGVYLQRGLGSLRTALARKPKLKGEFLAMLSDATAVKVMLPIIGAVRAGGWFFADGICFSRGRAVDTSLLSDEQRLQTASEESTSPAELRAETLALLAERLRTKFPAEYRAWLQKREVQLHREVETRRHWEKRERRNRVAAKVVLASIAAGVAYGLARLIQSLFQH